MGNCIRKEPSTQWGGEDWGSFGSYHRIGNSKSDTADGFIEEKGRGFVENEMGVISSGLPAPAGTHEVKIIISKKQLERLLKKADVEGVSAEQILAGLMNDGGEDLLEAHRRSWRPELWSIPE